MGEDIDGLEICPWVANKETLGGLLRLMMDRRTGPSADDPVAVLQAMCQVASYLRHATAGFFARSDDGRIVGVCLVASLTNGRLPDHGGWARREEELSGLLSSLVWWHDDVAPTLADIAEERELVRRVLASGLRPDAEILLVAWNRPGVGRRLVAEVGRMAERRQWDTLFLVTDTTRDWRRCEDWGFERVMSMPSHIDLARLRVAYAITLGGMPAAEGD